MPLIHRYQTQSGAVLIISLVLLLLLSMIGISVSQNSGTEERMAGNSRDKNLSFQAAESALNAAEQALTTARSTGAMPAFASNGAGGYYDENPSNTSLNSDILTDSFWEGNNVISYTATLDGIDNDNHPRYIIQDLGCIPPCTTPATDPHNYRITTYATGGTTSAVTVLQSIFKI